MKPKIVITIDTEPDNQWDPALKKNPRFKNIHELYKLQRLFDKFGVKPTYLLTYSVIKSDGITVLKEIAGSKACEIGAHLHAWETPPFQPQIEGDGSYLHQYAFAVQNQKLANLDRLISDTFGRKAVSYRAGRYSFDHNTILLLAEHGYLVDTSVTPGISWENDGGTNFKKFPRKEYFLKIDKKPGIFEVPVSIRIKTKFSPLAKEIYLNTPNWTHAEGILRRIAAFNIIWLDPSFNACQDMQWLCDRLLEEEASSVNIMFHSCVIIPGGSPYTMDQEKTDGFFERLEGLLDYLVNKMKLESLTLGGFYEYRRAVSEKQI